MLNNLRKCYITYFQINSLPDSPILQVEDVPIQSVTIKEEFIIENNSSEDLLDVVCFIKILFSFFSNRNIVGLFMKLMKINSNSTLNSQWNFVI